MERYLYLFLDLGALIVPLLFSFHPRIRLHLHWRALWPAILLVAALFIAWDVTFTSMGVWGFNERYLVGFDLLGIPIEEWLFFICIPYACLFTYFVFSKISPDPWSPRIVRAIAWILVVTSIVIGIFNWDKWYTASTCLALGATLVVLLTTQKVSYLGRFLVSFLVLLIPFFLINGTLTGYFSDHPVVWYDDAENLGIRMGTIPVEDTFYAILMLLLNVVLFERWKKVDTADQ